MQFCHVAGRHIQPPRLAGHHNIRSRKRQFRLFNLRPQLPGPRRAPRLGKPRFGLPRQPHSGHIIAGLVHRLGPPRHKLGADGQVAVRLGHSHQRRLVLRGKVGVGRNAVQVVHAVQVHIGQRGPIGGGQLLARSREALQ